MYDREDGTRVIYAVNTDWWSSDARAAKAELYLKDRHCTVDIPRDRITRITINGDHMDVTSDMEPYDTSILCEEKDR